VVVRSGSKARNWLCLPPLNLFWAEWSIGNGGNSIPPPQNKKKKWKGKNMKE